MKTLKIFCISLILNSSFFILNSAQAQANRHQLREGNRQYKKEKYDQAEINYRRALERDSLDFRGQFNLANSLYRQHKYDDAARHFDQALQYPEISNPQRAKSHHNKGNSFLKAGMENREQGMQLFQQAVNSYQEALKLDPKNNDTRYNLAYARRLLQQAQQQQQQQQGGGQNQQDQNQQDRQQQQGGGQNQDQQKQQNQNQQGQNQQDQNQKNGNQRDSQKNPSKMDQRKQDAERMLEAVKNNERQTLKDQQKKVQVTSGRHTDKDW